MMTIVFKPPQPPQPPQITLPQRDLQFATFTSLLGFHVMGIWPPYATGAHSPPAFKYVSM